MGWETSGRRAQLPPDWRNIRDLVKDRARGQCQSAAHEPDCEGVGAECDHIGDRNDHSLANLQWLSTPCHKAKTLRERPGRWRRPPERHPGLI